MSSAGSVVRRETLPLRTPTLASAPRALRRKGAVARESASRSRHRSSRRDSLVSPVVMSVPASRRRPTVRCSRIRGTARSRSAWLCFASSSGPSPSRSIEGDRVGVPSACLLGQSPRDDQAVPPSTARPSIRSGNRRRARSRKYALTCRSESNEPTVRANCSQSPISTLRIALFR